MTEQPEHLALPGMSGGVGHVVGRVLPFVKLSVLAVSIAAAVPTARNLYYSWSQGIPFNEVAHRLTQYDLWMKNLDCRIEYRALSTAVGGRVDVGACPKTGDIAIKITGRSGSAAYEWIAFDQLQKPKQEAAGLMDLLFPTAHAETPRAPAGATRPVEVAQAAGMEVMCQAVKSGKIVRVIKDGGKCYREVVSPLKGSVESRQEVACTSKC